MAWLKTSNNRTLRELTYQHNALLSVGSCRLASVGCHGCKLTRDCQDASVFSAFLRKVTDQNWRDMDRGIFAVPMVPHLWQFAPLHAQEVQETLNRLPQPTAHFMAVLLYNYCRQMRRAWAWHFAISFEMGFYSESLERATRPLRTQTPDKDKFWQVLLHRFALTWDKSVSPGTKIEFTYHAGRSFCTVRGLMVCMTDKTSLIDTGRDGTSVMEANWTDLEVWQMALLWWPSKEVECDTAARKSWP